MRFKAVLAAGLFGLLPFSAAACDTGPALSHDTLAEGDVVFIGGTDIWTEMAASFSTTDPRYGHVGILVREESGWAVIDAGGDMLGPGPKVASRPLDDFLCGAERAGVYRPDLSQDQAETFIAFAREAAARAVPFDREWRLETDESWYCTEFVWRALIAAVGGEPVPRRTKAGSLEIIALDDLQASPHLHLIEDAFTR